MAHAPSDPFAQFVEFSSMHSDDGARIAHFAEQAGAIPVAKWPTWWSIEDINAVAKHLGRSQELKDYRRLNQFGLTGRLQTEFLKLPLDDPSYSFAVLLQGHLVSSRPAGAPLRGLVEAAGCAYSQLADWIAGVALPTPTKFECLLTAFGLTGPDPVKLRQAAAFRAAFQRHGRGHVRLEQDQIAAWAEGINWMRRRGMSLSQFGDRCGISVDQLRKFQKQRKVRVEKENRELLPLRDALKEWAKDPTG